MMEDATNVTDVDLHHFKLLIREGDYDVCDKCFADDSEED